MPYSTRVAYQNKDCDGRSGWLHFPKTETIRNICGRSDMPVEEISNAGGSKTGTSHWAMIHRRRGGGESLFFFFTYATWSPTTTAAPTFRPLLTPLHYSLATTNLAYLQARFCTRPHLLQIALGVTSTDDSCSTPFFSEARSETIRLLV